MVTYLLFVILGIGLIIWAFWYDKTSFKPKQKRNGKMTKPYHKRWWIWTIAVFMVIGGLGNMLGMDDEDDDADNSSAKTEQTSKKKPASHKKSAKTESSTQSKKSKPKESKSKVPEEYKNALATAEEYNEDQPMSKAGLLDQLTSKDGEGFTQAAGEYAVNHIQANWNENALKCAKDYEKTEHLSRADVQDQLGSSIDDGGEGFTQSEVQYAMNHLPQ